MSIKSLQDYTYFSKYARYNGAENRRETWHEAIDRVKEMHLDKYADKEINEDIEWAFDLVKQKRVLGSQRALQFGGIPIKKKNARIYNCTVSFCDRLRFFQECFWLLLCGCGTGFSVQTHHVAKLPGFTDERLNNDPHRLRTFVVPDTVEGWADALGILMSTYFPNEEFADWAGCEVEFDYSQVRPAGSHLASGVGKAPGPDPLKRSLEIIRELLDRCVADGQTRLRAIDAYDIVMHASDAVLSGGVRRSATICIFSHDDEEMATAKTGNWFVENPQRSRANNSALLLRNDTKKEEFMSLINSVRQFGEPGFYWSDSTEQLPNPCVEIGMWPVEEETNESGWQFCVSGHTSLLTRNGIVRNIKDVVGREVEIWNGKDWKKVTPFQTGENRRLYRVVLSDGSFLDCTDNHRWLVKHRFMDDYKEVETKDLLSFSKYSIQVPPPNVQWQSGDSQPMAYELGYILGDGCAKRTDCKSGERLPTADLFEDIHLPLKCRVVGEGTNEYGTNFQTVAFDGVDRSFVHSMKYDHGLPDEVFSWSRKSAIDFVAGWIDADGTLAGRGFRIYGREDKVRDLQLLLTKLGFYSSVNLMSEAGEITNFGERKNDVWYVQVSDVGDLYSHRLNIKQKPRKQAGKGQQQLVEDVIPIPGRHDTFCLTEEDEHNCLFGTVLTKQCNLCEINGRKIKCKEDFALAARAAAIIGTLQAGYADFSYLGPVTERIVRREALLGVSITGMMDNPDVLFDPDNQKEMAKLVIKTNEWMAKKIGINPAARCTCVKPAGTTSCILGTASGIHPHHARRYLRRVQGNALEHVLQHFKNTNDFATEKSVWSANGTDEVITFCIEVPDGSKTKNDTSAIDLLDHVKSTQQNWVTYGKVKKHCTKDWLTHNVSNTINVRPDEWDEVADYIFKNRKWFAGISLLPQSGDLDYQQAPMVCVHTPREILQMYGDGSIMASGLIVDGLKSFGNNLWSACDAVLGLGEAIVEPERPGNGTINMNDYKSYEADLGLYEAKLDWIRRVKQFADRYCGQDERKCTYLLKEVHNWKLWLDLQREWQDVDYTELYEAEDNTKVMDTVACGGGACELVM